MLLPKFASKPDGPYRRPSADVYTVLLIIALIALLLGIICLYGEMSMYEFETDGGPTVSAGFAPTVNSPRYCEAASGYTRLSATNLAKCSNDRS